MYELYHKACLFKTLEIILTMLESFIQSKSWFNCWLIFYLQFVGKAKNGLVSRFYITAWSFFPSFLTILREDESEVLRKKASNKMESHIKLESTKEIAIWQERAFSIELVLDSILIFSIYAILKINFKEIWSNWPNSIWQMSNAVGENLDLQNWCFIP